MRVLVEIEDVDVVQLDVEVLVDGLEGAADADVVLELDGDDLVGEGFEETASVIILKSPNRKIGRYLKNSIMTKGREGGTASSGERWRRGKVSERGWQQSQLSQSHFLLNLSAVVTPAKPGNKVQE